MLNQKWLWLVLAIVIVGCGRSAVTATPSRPSAPPAAQPTIGSLPPTFTPPATAVPRPTETVRPTPTTAVTATAIDFDKTAVQLHYVIPAIGLDRSLRGNISGQIALVDHTTGQTRQYDNQSNTLIELQQVLPSLVLEPIPDGCQTCVQLSYELPIAGEADSGWLQDVTVLVSLENYTTAALGPHFPPGTVVGLHRSISPFAPAHTIALTEDGRLWRWLASDNQIADPVDAAAPNLPGLVSALPLDELAEDYAVNCDGTPVEFLFVSPDRAPIQIACPEFSLPSVLLPLYLALDELLVDTLADTAVPPPPSVFPLDALLDYRRADDTRLTLFYDGRVIVTTASETYTSTLAIAQITGLTAALLGSGQLQPGLTSFHATATPAPAAAEEAAPAASQLLVRGPQGVYDGKWTGIPDLPDLNALLESFLPRPDAAVTETAASTPLSTGVTSEPTLTPTPNP